MPEKKVNHTIDRRRFLGQVAQCTLSLAALSGFSPAQPKPEPGKLPATGGEAGLWDPGLDVKAKVARVNDWRWIGNGHAIPSLNYSDQPFIVKADDGAWVCVMTTGVGHEGQHGQHIIITRSTDVGRTWSPPLALEPPDGPVASYAVLLKVSSGRIYCFYNHNSDNLPWVKADNPPYKTGRCTRVDTLGYFVFKYSDDHGQNWSAERTAIQVRAFEIDRNNPYGGKVRFFWNVGRPFLHQGAAYVPLIKVGNFGQGFLTRTEGVLLRSADLPGARDPRFAAWETLPEGDIGLRTPPGGGPIAEEQSYVTLSDESFYAIYRTVDGHPAYALSRDGGRTWTPPRYATYANGRPIRHPRAANFAWRCANGRFLYWFHNHGGRSYQDRNPVWLCGGVEADSPQGKVIQWSQPEILLYDDNTFQRMSYPDLIEDGGRYFVTETQKKVARVHEIPVALVEGLWGQFGPGKVTRAGLLLELRGRVPATAPMPALPDLVIMTPTLDWADKSLPLVPEVPTRKGFTLEFRVRLDSLAAGQILLDSLAPDGQGGILVRTTDRRTIEILLSDGRAQCSWDGDPGRIEAGRRHHLAIVVDGGPHIITFIIDGILCDGGEARPFGWGRFSPQLRHAGLAPTMRIGEGLKGRLDLLRIYGRALTTSEVVGNSKA